MVESMIERSASGAKARESPPRVADHPRKINRIPPLPPRYEWRRIPMLFMKTLMVVMMTTTPLLVMTSERVL